MISLMKSTCVSPFGCWRQPTLSYSPIQKQWHRRIASSQGVAGTAKATATLAFDNILRGIECLKYRRICTECGRHLYSLLSLFALTLPRLSSSKVKQ